MPKNKAVITPGLLKGSITPPVSKSAAHRAIMCAAMSCGISEISPYLPSEDIDATICAMKALGAEINIIGKKIIIDGTNTFKSVGSQIIDCRESGSLLRFIIPCAAVAGISATFTGKGRLPVRPIDPYIDLFPSFGVNCEYSGSLPLKIDGKLKNGKYSLAGNISSQFITGLLLALPLAEGDSEIILTTPLESAGYIDLTLEIMNDFGVSVTKSENGYLIKGGQTYKNRKFEIERDWSQAAFWLAAGALGCDIKCCGMKLNSAQGDREILSLLRKFGAEIKTENEKISVIKNKLKAIEIDASQIPDLIPILSVVASVSEGTTTIRNAVRLRLKESDRLHTVAVDLNSIGADITELDDGLIIKGVDKLIGGTADGFNDHRIVMALSIASICCNEKVEIEGCETVDKTYPEFFSHFNNLGGLADVVNLG